jgi:hypothetical protein
VQSGSCKTSVDGGELTLNGGEFIALDKATYAFDVVGDHQLTLLKVFSAA